MKPADRVLELVDEWLPAARADLDKNPPPPLNAEQQDVIRRAFTFPRPRARAAVRSGT